MNGTIEVISNRMSLRKYMDKPIKREHLDIILESAMRAPTAGNMMMYSMLIVEDEEKKKKLSKTCDNQPFIARAPLIIIFLADMQRWYDYFEYCGVNEFCNKKGMNYEGPDEGNFMLAVNDAIIAGQNAVIAAESLGIGSCYIGDIMENYEIHREMFNLPKWTFPAAMLCLGYYSDDCKKTIKSRYNKEYIVFKNEYKKLNGNDFKDMYGELEKKLPKTNKYDAENIGQLIYARKVGSEFAAEMGRSVREGIKNWNGEKL